MKVIVGLIDGGGSRRVLMAAATPSLRDILDMSRNGIDWGMEASEESRERLAAIILGAMVPMHHNIAGGMVIRFAKDVVENMDAGKMFVITEIFIEDWVDGNYRQ